MKKQKNKLIGKDMTFSEVLEKYPKLAETFFEQGMHCIGCPMSSQESLEQGALAHDINPNELIEKLNKKIKGK